MLHADSPVTAFEASSGVVSLNTFGRALRYRKLLVTVFALLGLATGFLVAARAPAAYQATAIVQVNRGLVGLDPNVLGLGSGVNTQNEAQFAQSGTVAALAALDSEGSPSPRQLLGGLQVGIVEDTSYLTFNYTAATPEAAQAGANAFADAYLTARGRALDELLDRSRTVLSRRYDEAAAQLTGGAETSRPEALRAQLSSYSEQLGRLASVVVDPGLVVSRAPLPASSTGLPRLIAPVAGLLIGFLLGWALAVVRERAASPVRDVDDLRQLGLPVLGTWSSSRRDSDDVCARLTLQLRSAHATALVVSEAQRGAAVTDDVAEGLQRCGMAVEVLGREQWPKTPAAAPSQARAARAPALAPAAVDVDAGAPRVAGPARATSVTASALVVAPPSEAHATAAAGSSDAADGLARAGDAHEVASADVERPQGQVVQAPADTSPVSAQSVTPVEMNGRVTAQPAAPGPPARAAATADADLGARSGASAADVWVPVGRRMAAERQAAPGGDIPRGAPANNLHQRRLPPLAVPSPAGGAAALPITLVPVPSVFCSAAGLLRAADVGNAVIVCERGYTRLADVEKVLPDLSRSGVTLLGVILL